MSETEAGRTEKRRSARPEADRSRSPRDGETGKIRQRRRQMTIIF